MALDLELKCKRELQVDLKHMIVLKGMFFIQSLYVFTRAVAIEL